MNKLEIRLEKAINACLGITKDNGHPFFKIYPFTTENIGGYVQDFNLENNNLLTVGSSCDQIFNSILYGSLKQTIYDICPFVEYYYNLKKACIIGFNYAKFLNFFSDINLNDFNKIKYILKEIDEDSYLFWNELFSVMEIDRIKNYILYSGNFKFERIGGCNPYLEKEENYNKLKKLVLYNKPNFYEGDIYNIEINDSFDNIWLSNLSSYVSVTKYYTFLNKINKLLNNNGKMLIVYLYSVNLKNSNWVPPIYTLEETRNILNNYITYEKDILGVQGMLFKDELRQDKVLIYQKRK